MGLPARKHEAAAPRTPHLRVVAHKPRGKKRKATRCQRNAATYQAYVFFATIIIVIALAGMARVWLSVQAAEASVEAANLRKEIKLARYAGDMLEIRQSALAAPSRVQAIAGQAMGMAPISGVDYLDLRQANAAPLEGTKQTAQADTGSGVADVLSAAMDLAAGEAHVMLVGDVGLASAK